MLGLGAGRGAVQAGQRTAERFFILAPHSGHLFMEILLQTIKMQRDRKIPLPDRSIIARKDSRVSAMKVPKKCHIYVGLGGLMPPVITGRVHVPYLLNTFCSASKSRISMTGGA